MRKIIVGLMIFTLMGGGTLFAQLEIGGLVSGGVGVLFPAGADEARIAPLTHDAANQAFRTQLDVRYTSSGGGGGVALRIRAQGHTPSTGAPPAGFSTYIDWSYAWFSFNEDIVRLYGGRVNNSVFNSLDRMRTEDAGEGLGALAIIRPMSGLRLGVGVYADGEGDMLLQHEEGPPARRQARYTLNLRYDHANFRVIAGWRNSSETMASGMLWDHAAGMNPRPPVSVTRAQPSLAYVSAGLFGVSGVHAAFTARFMFLEEFMNYGDMRFYATFGHTGLIQGADLRLGLSFGRTMQERLRNGIEPVPHMWAWFSGTYALNNVIRPGLHIHYVRGGVWNGFQRLHHWSAMSGATFDEEHEFLQFRPNVQFRLTAARYVEIGAVLHVDVSAERIENAGTPTAAVRNGTWGPGLGINHGFNAAVYTVFRFSF